MTNVNSPPEVSIKQAPLRSPDEIMKLGMNGQNPPKDLIDQAIVLTYHGLIK